MRCLVCGSEGAADLCRHHLYAKKSLDDAYPLWAEAYGEIGWKSYLDNVKRNVQTGQWVKELIGFWKANR